MHALPFYGFFVHIQCYFNLHAPFHLIVKEGSVKMSLFGSKFIVFVFGNKI